MLPRVQAPGALAPKVMGGNPSVAEEDGCGLERRTVELASIEWEARAEELRETWRMRRPGVTS